MKLAAILFLLILMLCWLAFFYRQLGQRLTHIRRSMSQLGLQLESCFDALDHLLNLTHISAPAEIISLQRLVILRRFHVSAASTPQDVLEQQAVIDHALHCVYAIAHYNEELCQSDGFRRSLTAVECYRKMLHTSGLIYNDSVFAYHQVMLFPPIRLIAAAMGFPAIQKLEIIPIPHRAFALIPPT